MTRVKICGIQCLEDALLAVRLGADAIGLLVGQRHTSSDFLTPESARAITAALPPFCASVLVTHLNTTDEIAKLVETVQPNTIQLHGQSSPQVARDLRSLFPHLKLVQAIHMTDESSLQDAQPFEEVVDAILTDSVNQQTGQVGGTGLTHDWGLSRRLVETNSLPVILAGGLNPDNVAEAIAAVRPFGVDVNSGVKDSNGRKHSAKLAKFIETAKQF